MTSKRASKIAKKENELFSMKYVYNQSKKLKKVYLCEKCDYSTVKNSDLLDHIQLHSQNGEFKCRFCERSFSLDRYRIRHEKHECKQRDC